MTKTNAMRLLDNENIDYEIITYESDDGQIDGISVSNKIGKQPYEVYKTLVGQGEREIYVFIIPSDEELDLKKAAKVTKEKKVQLISVKDIKKHTGYIRGGCSPIGMKKDFPSFVHEDNELLDEIIVSGGMIGSQIQLDPEDLLKVINGKSIDLVK